MNKYILFKPIAIFEAIDNLRMWKENYGLFSKSGYGAIRL